MLDLPLLLSFVAAATILTITPGVDTAMVIRAATMEGKRSGILAGAGILCGCLIWGAAVSLGLSALLLASEMGYTIVKFAGAAYLVWLGVGLLLRPREALAIGSDSARRGGAAFRRGLLTNLLNPKIGVFYITFLPQFIPAGASIGLYSLFLAVVHVALTLVWFAALIAGTAPLGRFLRKPGAVKTLDRLTGGVFVGFGLKLATARVAR
jgi:threonine/homoserine/homoserine lactone efflux protein